MALPNLIIIGAMKCGTSSMHNYLDAHPEISMSRQKELNFFSFDRHWARGEDWYGRHFSSTAGNPRRVVSELQQISQSSSCSRADKNGNSISSSHISCARSRRANCLALHASSRWGKENRSLNEALSQFEGNQYIDCSRYHMQLQQYSRSFSAISNSRSERGGYERKPP